MNDDDAGGCTWNLGGSVFVCFGIMVATIYMGIGIGDYIKSSGKAKEADAIAKAFKESTPYFELKDKGVDV
jgi:ABC-type phosphate transport system permease subunit